MNLINFKRVMNQIRALPESWDQELYHNECGTAHCIAGHAQIFWRTERGMSVKPSELFENWRTMPEAMAFLDLKDHWAFPYIFEQERTFAELAEVERGERDPMTGERL